MEKDGIFWQMILEWLDTHEKQLNLTLSSRHMQKLNSNRIWTSMKSKNYKTSRRKHGRNIVNFGMGKDL